MGIYRCDRCSVSSSSSKTRKPTVVYRDAIKKQVLGTYAGGHSGQRLEPALLSAYNANAHARAVRFFAVA